MERRHKNKLLHNLLLRLRLYGFEIFAASCSHEYLVIRLALFFSQKSHQVFRFQILVLNLF